MALKKILVLANKFCQRFCIFNSKRAFKFHFKLLMAPCSKGLFSSHTNRIYTEAKNAPYTVIFDACGTGKSMQLLVLSFWRYSLQICSVQIFDSKFDLILTLTTWNLKVHNGDLRLHWDSEYLNILESIWPWLLLNNQKDWKCASFLVKGDQNLTSNNTIY